MEFYLAPKGSIFTQQRKNVHQPWPLAALSEGSEALMWQRGYYVLNEIWTSEIDGDGDGDAARDRRCICLATEHGVS